MERMERSSLPGTAGVSPATPGRIPFGPCRRDACGPSG
jgi:hypothetical protein